MTSPKKIMFLGGSITCGGNATDHKLSWPYVCYSQIAQGLFCNNATYLNASISGTGSFVAAMRLGQHVLPYAPDMVFIEFSVNDLGDAASDPDLVISSLDYIIQSLIKVNPHVAITFVYTTVAGKNASATHSIVAKHYGIPEIDFQTPMAAEVNAGRCSWDYYLPDNVHPNDIGHKFYGDIAAQAVLADPERFTSPTRHAESIAKYPFHDPRIIPVTEAFETTGFTYGLVSDDTHIKHLPELKVTHGSYSRKPGASMKVRFHGSHFGIYHRLYTNCGCASVSIDGEYAGKLNCYHNYAASYKDCGEFFCLFKKTGLAEGEHVAEITLLDEKHENSDGNHMIIAGFLVG